MPKISVITCTCRDNPNLDKMAQCLVDQTFTDFEWVIVDRKLRTRPTYYNIVRRIVGGKFPVRVIEPKWSIYHDFNMPAMSNARNSGIMEAQGDILVWVDDNIWFKPDFLYRHYKGNQVTYSYDGNPCHMVGLGWSFKDWHNVADLATHEPFDLNNAFCRTGSFDANNTQNLRDTSASLADDPRAYANYPQPSGKPIMIGDYELVSGAWCYGRNMSMSLEASLAINGNDEDYDGVPEPQDCDYGLRLNNYGVHTILDRQCCVYEYLGDDNKVMQSVHPFLWGHIGEVNGIKVTRGEYRIWAIMKTPTRWRANAHFDLRADRDEFRGTTYRVGI